MATFTEQLRARGETGLAALLGARPDLAAPPPATVRSLAARATNRASLDRVLATVDATVLAVLEASLALTPVTGALPGAIPPSPASVRSVVAATGVAEADVVHAARSALDLALLWNDDAPDVAVGLETVLRPAPGLDEALGPYPAGLGPPLVAALGRRSPQGLARLATDLGLPERLGVPDAAAPGPGPADGVRAAGTTAAIGVLAAHLTDPLTVVDLLDRAPTGARSVLEALTWGPPVGRSPVPAPGQEAGPGRTAVEWLLRHGLLSVGDPQHVVLPREIALVLRGGRTHATAPVTPTPPPTRVDVRSVDAESARHALEVVRLTTALITAWGADPPPVLRAGGLGTRELRRTGGRLEVDDRQAALLVEIAGAAALVADDGEDPPSIAPTADADDWLRLPLPQRWERLAEAWLTSERAAWLVGTRDDRGALRAALDPEGRRPWAPRLRRTVLDVLAGATGTDADRPADGPDRAGALTPAQVHEVLTWQTPRSAPPLHAVEAVLTEATALGILGAGALSAPGHALVSGLTGAAVDAASAAATALADRLPPTVEEILLQGDLTGVVPGRPVDELAALVDLAAHVESRGAGLTVRFTETSVRHALDEGRTAEDLLAELSRFARSGVPQPLEYLVLDVARRHGRVRVGMASSYLRADDPALLAGLVEDKALRGLGLLLLAPTVIAAQVTPAVLLAALRDRGLSPVGEDSGGAVVVARSVTRARRARGRRRAPAVASPQRADEARDRRLLRLAKDLLSADRREDRDRPTADAPPGPAPSAGFETGPVPDGDDRGTPDPVLALALLREAVAEGREVWLDIVGPAGGSIRRRVRPLRVDAGRVRVIDPDREAELTVAVHRIAGVTPI